MVELLQDGRHKRRQVLQSVAWRFNHEHGDRQGCEVLLKLKIPVHRQKRFKSSGGECEQLSVLDS